MRVPVVVYLSNGVPIQYQADLECLPPRTEREQASIRVTFETGTVTGAAIGIGLDDIATVYASTEKGKSDADH